LADGERDVSDFTIEIDLDRSHWAVVSLRAGDSEFSEAISYISDGLGDVAASVERVVTGRAAEDTCHWMNEPGAWVVTLAAADADIRFVIAFDEHESSRSIRPNLPVFFEAFCPSRRMARRVPMAFADLENSYGREGYRERWRHLFPENELASLKRWHESTAPADSRSA